jgi:transcriptional regulator with XRE-family HTH domain
LLDREINRDDISNRLKILRKAVGETQRSFAKKINSTYAKYVKYEYNELTQFDLSFLDYICLKFGYRFEWLVYGELPEKVDQNRREMLARLINDGKEPLEFPDLVCEIIEAYIELDSTRKQIFNEFLQSFIKKKALKNSHNETTTLIVGGIEYIQIPNDNPLPDEAPFRYVKADSDVAKLHNVIAPLEAEMSENVSDEIPTYLKVAQSDDNSILPTTEIEDTEDLKKLYDTATIEEFE